MQRGFLLIDCNKNTVLLPFSDRETLVDLLQGKVHIKHIKPHDTINQLDKDVRDFLLEKYRDNYPED